MEKTPYYQFPYLTEDDQLYNTPEVSQKQAERYEKALKDAQVPPGVIDAANLNNRMAALEDRLKLRHAEFYSGQVTSTGSGWLNLGTLTQDNGNTTGPQIAKPKGSEGQIEITGNGRFTVWAFIMPDRPPGNGAILLQKNGITIAANGFSGANWEMYVQIPSAWLGPGDTISAIVNPASGVKVSGRIYIERNATQ